MNIKNSTLSIQYLIYLFAIGYSLMATTPSFAQNGNIRGFVYNQESGDPVIFTSVFLQGTTTGAVTDINGFYSISGLKAGTYTVVCRALGFDSVSYTISLAKDEIYKQNFNLDKNSVELKGVDVSAAKIEKENNVQISTVKITSQDIKHIPAVGGEPDLAQYLQILPGVIFTGDQGGQLYIRGGAPIQNKVLLDGMTIYNPFHSIGLFSVFETDIIRNVDVMTGGFNAEYGDRISAIVDITTKDGNKKELSGKISANPFISSLLLEGPISKLKDDGSSSSFIFSAKHSYLDKSSKVFYDYIDTGGLPYNFTDLYGKVSFNSANGSKINFFGFNYNDNVNFTSISDLHWDALGFGTNFVIVPGNSQVIINGKFSYSDYEITLAEADNKPRFSSIGGFNAGMDFTYFIEDGEVKYGFEVLGFKTAFEFFNSLGFRLNQTQNTTELAGFVKYKKKIGKLLIEPSLRLQYYATLSTPSIEPRIGLKYNATDRLRFKFAGGRFTQNLISTISDRDVVNLFSGYLSGPEVTLYDLDGKEVRANIQKSLHAIAGVEYDITNHLEINVEPYVKDFTQLINLNRNKLFDSDPDYIIEEGIAYGIDFLLKYEYKRWFLWLVYSHGYVKRNDGNQVYPPHFDRRHNVNFVGSKVFGKDLNWEVSTRWNLGSGFPFTQTQGFYEEVNFSNGVGSNYTTQNGNLGIIYADKINGGRLPYYHRLDLAVKRTFFISEDSELEVNATVTNVYNRENIFYFDRIRYERVNQLPIIPSLGLKFVF